jgi:Protein of unknown function (DUF2652)
MNPRPADGLEPVLLIIADISGYTRYMTANAKTLAHSHTIITELIQAMIQEIQLPLEVAKLEGDAIFVFCRKQNSAHSWPETRRLIGARLLELFSRFGEKLGELVRSATCTCHACTHIEKLRLKIIVHSGEALFHRVLGFLELAGVDVIIVHRLLKNSVQTDQYLLLTESARRDLEFPEIIALSEGAETYDDVGRVNTLLYLPSGENAAAKPVEMSFGTAFGQSWTLFLKLWFAPMSPKRSQFRNVSSSTGHAGKIAFALLTSLLTPFYVPVGTVLVLFHARKAGDKHRHVAGCDEHKPDGSCCGKG